MRSLIMVLAAVGFLSVGACALEAKEKASSNESGLVAHYSFDEGAGTVAKDSSGNGNDGKIMGDPTYVKGDFGTALSFDGVNDYVDCGKKEILNLGKAGSLMFWFKPSQKLKGGLVGWSTEKGKNGRRLVTSLDPLVNLTGNNRGANQGLVVDVSDGKASWKAHASRFHQGYVPQGDKWEFMAVTFNGQNVDIYRDGVHVYSRFQVLNPNTKDIALLIAKARGIGFFKGLIDEVRVYNRALPEQEVYEVYKRDAEGRGKDTSTFGSIGIKPTALPRAGTIFADLDYRGLVPTPPDLSIKADLLDAKGAVAAPGKIRMIPAWGRAEAVFDVHNLPAGEYKILATGTKGKPGVTKVTWPGRAKGWENIKVLNNFVWELLNVSDGANPKKEYKFTNPRKGWVYFIVETKGDLKLSVPSAKPDIIHPAPELEGLRKVMRYLPQGEHTIAVTGDGSLDKLIVRAIPVLTFGHYPHLGPGTGNDHDFLVKNAISNANMLLTGSYGEAYNTGKFRTKWTEKLGRKCIQIVGTRFEVNNNLKPETAVQQIYDFLAKQPGMNNPDFTGVQLDEFDPGNKTMAGVPCFYDEWNAAITKILSEPKYADRLIIPYTCYNMYDFEKSASFIKNICDLGSYFAWEVYFDERNTEIGAWIYINEGLGEMAIEHEKAIPGCVNNMILVLSMLRREYWNPKVDFNVYMDMQMQHLATRPEFFGLAGIEEYVSHYGTEEYTRWQNRLYEHYGLEGKTERLSKDPYVLSHIKNVDFTDGTDGWTIEPAAKDSIAPTTHKGYGVLQSRYPYRAATDTTFLRTRRSKDKPNVFSQQINNLKPGRMYLVTMDTGDNQEFVNGKSTPQDHVVSVDIKNGDMVNDWYRAKLYKNDKANQWTYSAYRAVGKFNDKNRFNINKHRYMFRAKGTTAKLIISDWKSPTDPGGPVGQELIFNSIEVKPYFER